MPAPQPSRASKTSKKLTRDTRFTSALNFGDLLDPGTSWYPASKCKRSNCMVLTLLAETKDSSSVDAASALHRHKRTMVLKNSVP